MLQRTKPAKRVPVDRDALAWDLGTLHTLLSLNRVSAANKFRQLKDVLPKQMIATNWRSRFPVFDFKGAQASLKRLAESMGIAIEEQP